MFGLETDLLLVLGFCILCVCFFEFINGFHDTANAVATVIYTHSLKPIHAVILSGLCNSAGVFVGGIAVAVGIIQLLPVEMMVGTNVYQNVAMALALLLTAIIWNLGTWYYGIPCSSSHTLIGSILGVGFAYSFLPHSSGDTVNWSKAGEIGMSLLISPAVGFGLTMGLMYLLKKFAGKQTNLFEEPKQQAPPPFWIRLTLILTCTGVSFSHGSNDGQKGVGLLMLILISILPAYFALNHSLNPSELKTELNQVQVVMSKIDSSALKKQQRLQIQLIHSEINHLQENFLKLNSADSLDIHKHITTRESLFLLKNNLKNILRSQNLKINEEDKVVLKQGLDGVSKYVDYAPTWTIVLISLCLGLGTMIGWKRIVVTIGERIGKTHLTYSQGAAAELVATTTIGFSTGLGLPVSTTHVLSSGIAGSMVSMNGWKNLRKKMIMNILLAWFLTLPFCIFVSGLLFWIFRSIL